MGVLSFMERHEVNQPVLPHQLVLHQRNLLDLEGVMEVEHFDECTVTLTTSQGELTICGRDLHVRQLNLEAGALSVEGLIDSITYHDLRKRGGFLGRVLR